jgi:hypothetical protein
VRKTAAKFDVNPSTVQRIARPFDGAENASVAGGGPARKGPSDGMPLVRAGVSGPPWGGRAKIENSSRRHPRKLV